MIKDLSSSLPDWVQPGAVFEYRGGTEKILVIGARSVSTVGAESFITWGLTGFRIALAVHDISQSKRTHAVLADKTATAPQLPNLDGKAAEEFTRLHASFLDSSHPRTRMMRWARAVANGETAEPWVHMLALKLICLGAESLGYDPRIFAKDRRGRPSALKQATTDVQALIARFVKFLEGEEPISRTDWFKIRSIWERGMTVIGFLPAPTRTVRGRPVTFDSEVSWLRASIRHSAEIKTPISRTKLIRTLAGDRVLTRRKVAAAWRGENHEKITVKANDPDVEEEFKLIESRFHRHLRNLQRRSTR